MADKEKIKIGFYIKISLTLLVICALVAFMLSGINMLTKDAIAEKIEGSRSDAILEFFPDMAGYTEISGEYTKEISGMYSVTDTNGKEVGKCVAAASAGNDGDIEIMVGFDEKGKILGVKIISASETKRGFESPNHLAQYNGKKERLTLGVDIDAVAKVTVSSRGVNNAVNAAIAAIKSSEEVKK